MGPGSTGTRLTLKRCHGMAKQLVEVIDRNGHVVHSYVVQLAGEDCIEAEFEEVALVFAENHGLVPREEHVHLRARCVK